jgi:hypothetical protein
VTAKAARKPGRPSDFLPEYPDQSAKLCRLGATDAEIADFFGKDERTVNRWKIGESVAAMRHRSFPQEDYNAYRGRNEKPDLYAAASCIKVRPYCASPRYRTASKHISDLLERFRFAAGCDPEAAISQPLIRLLLFL